MFTWENGIVVLGDALSSGCFYIFSSWKKEHAGVGPEQKMLWVYRLISI